MVINPILKKNSNMKIHATLEAFRSWWKKSLENLEPPQILHHIALGFDWNAWKTSVSNHIKLLIPKNAPCMDDFPTFFVRNGHMFIYTWWFQTHLKSISQIGSFSPPKGWKSFVNHQLQWAISVNLWVKSSHLSWSIWHFASRQATVWLRPQVPYIALQVDSPTETWGVRRQKNPESTKDERHNGWKELAP